MLVFVVRTNRTMKQTFTLFPKTVCYIETWEPLKEPLFPRERLLLKNATASRVEEFTSVRACAQIALSYFGIARPPLIADSIRGPKWPSGFVGSLTHTGKYCAAAVARMDSYQSIGIDAEWANPLPYGLEERILTVHERKTDLPITSLKRDLWGTLLFSIKESVFKTWAPLTGEFLDFLQGEVKISEISPYEGTHVTRISNNDQSTICGRWFIRDGLIRTSAWVTP